MAKDEEVEWRRMRRFYIDVNYYNIRDLYERNLIIVRAR